MPIRSLGRRIERVGRTTSLSPVGRIVIIYPDDWSPADQVAYDAARDRGDRGTQADIVERRTGNRPVFPPGGWKPRMPPVVIEIRTRPDGPR